MDPQPPPSQFPQPPPLPAQPPEPPPFAKQFPPPAQTDSFEEYQRMAETVGFMPSVRLKDNLIQAGLAIVGAVVGAIVGWLIGEREPVAAMVGGVVGLFAFVLLSGIVLMFVGWARAGRSRR